MKDVNAVPLIFFLFPFLQKCRVNFSIDSMVLRHRVLCTMTLFNVYFFVFLLNVVKFSHGWHNRCERITEPTCQDLGYNLTTLPNLMDHKDQAQAKRALATFMPLVHYNCSRHLRLFLCSVITPMCSEQNQGIIPPCRSFCESIQADCQSTIDQFDIPWPSLLNCSRFPTHNSLCLSGNQSMDTGQSLSITTWPANNVRRQPVMMQCPPNFVQAHEATSITCSPHCGKDAYYRREDKLFAEKWMIGWAWLCFLSTSFTLLTFWVEPGRFRYPERPVIFLALCYCLIGVTYILRGALGSSTFSCVQVDDRESYIALDGMQSIPCTLGFLSLYYFSLASSIWWVVLALSWFLSAANKWSSEALHGLASYFHVAAWTGPAVLGIVALALRRISGDELTGLCQVSDSDALAFVVIPQAVLLAAGCGLAAIAAAALIRVRRAMQSAGRCTGKLERLMTRLGVFAILYVLPAIGYLACLIYEAWHRPRWRSLALLAALDCRIDPTCEPGPSYRTAGVEVALLRLFLSLVVGVTSGMWVWSGKTCRAWSRLFVSPKKVPPRIVGHSMHHISRV